MRRTATGGRGGTTSVSYFRAGRPAILLPAAPDASARMRNGLPRRMWPGVRSVEEAGLCAPPLLKAAVDSLGHRPRSIPALRHDTLKIRFPFRRCRAGPQGFSVGLSEAVDHDVVGGVD